MRVASIRAMLAAPASACSYSRMKQPRIFHWVLQAIRWRLRAIEIPTRESMCKYMMWQAVPRGRAAGRADREASKYNKGTSVQKRFFGRRLAGLIGALVLTGDGALAHHSFSMFEYGSNTEIEGTVQEFRY